MSDLQSIATASCNISLVLAKSHSDVSSRLITKYKYKDFKKLQRIFVVKTVVLNFAEEFIIHQMEEFHSLIVLGQKLNLQVTCHTKPGTKSRDCKLRKILLSLQATFEHHTKYYIIVMLVFQGGNKHLLTPANERLVSKETVLLRQSGNEALKFGIRPVDEDQISKLKR